MFNPFLYKKIYTKSYFIYCFFPTTTKVCTILRHVFRPNNVIITAWKDKQNRKPLLVTGIRQCGKTYLLREFGKQEFEHTAYFNFDGNAGLKSIFDFDFDVKRIVDELSTVYETKIVPGKTLLVFDEIQDCPRAIQSLKYFCEQHQKFRFQEWRTTHILRFTLLT